MSSRSTQVKHLSVIKSVDQLKTKFDNLSRGLK